LADQAEFTGYSVSTISAVERGTRTIPDGYADKVAGWLCLGSAERSELLAATKSASNVIKFRPKNEKVAMLAFELTHRLNELAASDIEKIRSLLDEGKKIYE
jgi:transcriptional regulator with XRE-family HTH domain